MVYPGFLSKALAMLEKYPEAAFVCGECEIANDVGTVLAIGTTSPTNTEGRLFGP